MDVVPFDVFTGLNTNASRPGIKDTETSICDGFFPIGDSFLRVLPGVGGPIFNARQPGRHRFWCSASPTSARCRSASPFRPTAASGRSTRTRWSPLRLRRLPPSPRHRWPPWPLATHRNNPGRADCRAADQRELVFDGTVFYQAGGVSPNIDITAGGSGNQRAEHQRRQRFRLGCHVRRVAHRWRGDCHRPDRAGDGLSRKRHRDPDLTIPAVVEAAPRRRLI